MKRFILIALAASFSWPSHGRPVDLSPPGNGLGSASPEGCVHIYRDIATVDFGNGLQLPLRVDFAGERKTSSPYLGPGWRCPLLESTAIPLREDLIGITLLCGKPLYLYRSKKSPTQYSSENKEWQGELKGSSLRVFRDDGWEMIFEKGHLVTLRTDKGRILVWESNEKRVATIKEGKSGGIFEITWDSATGQPRAFVVNGRAYNMSFADQRLQSVTWPNGEQESYTVSASQFVLKSRQKEEEIFTWDTGSGKILSDGEWTYQVGQAKDIYEQPAITRINKAGQKESYHFDAGKGISVSWTTDGTMTRQYFIKSHGPNYMCLRKVEQMKNGRMTMTLRRAYDSNGKLIRETQTVDGKKVVTNYEYDQSGNQVAAIQDGKLLWRKQYDSERRLVSIEYPVIGPTFSSHLGC